MIRSKSNILNKILYLELVSSTFSPFLTRFIIRKMVDEGTSGENGGNDYG